MTAIAYLELTYLENLSSNEEHNLEFSYPDSISESELKKIKIEPFRIENDEKGREIIVLCDKATINQEISC